MNFASLRLCVNTYDGIGSRATQTISSVVTRYLLDVQPGLTQVIAATTGANTSRHLHSPRGIHASESPAGDWTWQLQDGLGSVRGRVDTNAAMQQQRVYDPYGTPEVDYGDGFGYTGEWTDGNDLLYLCARYYKPGLGVFPSLDPFEDQTCDPMTLNRYAHVGGNPVTRTDPSGWCWESNNASSVQQSECYSAWQAYLDMINEQYPIHWPRDLIDLVYREGDYWANLSYSDFVSQWNSSRPTASTDPGGAVWQSSLPVIGGISFANPGPGPEDIIAIGGLCIAAIWAIVANAGAIALPLRQPFAFSLPSDQASDQAVPIPIPRPRDYDSCQNSWKNCAELEIDGGRFASFEDAIDEVKRVKSIEVFEDEDERLIPTRSHCPGMGSHSQFYDTPTYDEKFVASVTCCPCCNTDWGMPLPDVRCFVKYNKIRG